MTASIPGVGAWLSEQALEMLRATVGNALGNWVRRGSKQEANSTAPVSWTQHVGAPGQGRQR